MAWGDHVETRSELEAAELDRENCVADREHDGQRGIRVEAVAADQLKAGDMVLAGDRPHILVDDANAHHQGANPPTIWLADFRDPSIVDRWGQIWRVVRAQQPGEAITRDERHLRLVAARKPREVYAYTTEVAKRLLDQEGKHLVIDADQAGHLEFRLLDLEADLGVADTEREHDGLDDEECSLCGGKGWNAIPYIEEDPRRAAACCRCNGTGKVRP